MFWGYPDVSVSFCEDKYVVSDYIAEYYNTMSALSYVIVGLLFYRTRLKNLSLIIISLGLGTALLHSTLRYYGQWLDELSMLVLSFYIIKEIRRLRFKKKISEFYLLPLILPYFIFEGYFCYFFLVFASLQVYTYIIIQKDYKDYSTKEYLLVKGYSGVLIFSSLCWVADQLFCESVRNYQLHAVWHVGTALSILMGLTALLIK
jgi:dihydroceramidase